eukprot:TRINITY_DN4017_c0_g1_i5.p2 TRINITY_DN4017_c0_g1~~TRINITY_DN4017_c0_g1_i5.p2  ORF type:complete len:159 (+),score=31.92 TRINITY_DN4017_c0_g1_i5:11-487(+)
MAGRERVVWVSHLLWHVVLPQAPRWPVEDLVCMSEALFPLIPLVSRHMRTLSASSEYTATAAAARAGCTRFLRWYLFQFLCPDDLLLRIALWCAALLPTLTKAARSAACEAGRVQLAQELRERAGPAVADACAWYGPATRLARAAGHLDAAAWAQRVV